MTNKKCTICNIVKPLVEFSKNNQRKDGRGSYCKHCDNERKKKWASENKESSRASMAKSKKKYLANTPESKLKKMKKKHDHTRRLKKFGITQKQYDELHKKYNSSCAICKVKEVSLKNKKHKKLHIDHCHTTGKVRGLLCSKCNTALGLVNDNVKILQKLINYLEVNKNE